MEEKTNKGHNYEFKVINGKTTSIKMDGVELKAATYTHLTLQTICKT